MHNSIKTPARIDFKQVVLPKPDWTVAELREYLGIPSVYDLFKVEGHSSIQLDKNEQITVCKGDKFFTNEVIGVAEV